MVGHHAEGKLDRFHTVGGGTRVSHQSRRLQPNLTGARGSRCPQGKIGCGAVPLATSSKLGMKASPFPPRFAHWVTYGFFASNPTCTSWASRLARMWVAMPSSAAKNAPSGFFPKIDKVAHVEDRARPRPALGINRADRESARAARSDQFGDCHLD